MLQKKKVGAALAVFTGLLGVSGAAFALPEVDVGTMPPIVAPQSVNAVDSAVAEPEGVDTQANAS